MKSRSWLAMLLLAALAGCSGGRTPEVYVSELDDTTDPQTQPLREEIRTLPMRHVVWDNKLERRISRVTLGSEYLYVETPDCRVIAMDRFDGMTKWIYTVDTETPLEWAPVEAYGVADEIRACEADVRACSRKVDDIVKEKGPGNEAKEAQKKRDQAHERLRQARAGDNVYFISRGVIYCLVRTTGALLWSRSLTNEFVPSAQPFAIRTHVFVPAGNLSRVWALETGKGKSVNSFATSLGANDKSVTNRPIYEDPALYYVSHDGGVYSYHLVNGTLNWRFPTDGELRSDPVVYKHREATGETNKDGKPVIRETRYLFVGGFDQTFYAIDAAGGNLLWKYETAGIMKTPAVAKDATVYVKTEDGALFALEVNPQLRDAKGKSLGPRRFGQLRWKLPLGERFLVKGKDHVYVLGPNHEICRMDEKTGQDLGRYPLNLFPMVLTNTMDDILYVAHPYGYLYALREPKE